MYLFHTPFHTCFIPFSKACPGAWKKKKKPEGGKEEEEEDEEEKEEEEEEEEGEEEEEEEEKEAEEEGEERMMNERDSKWKMAAQINEGKGHLRGFKIMRYGPK